MRLMATILLGLAALTGCGDRRTFDERYNDAGKELEERARAIDENIANELPSAGEANAS